MTERMGMSYRWIIGGALAVVGAYWLIAFVLLKLHVESDYLPYAAHAIAGASVGVIVTRFAMVRPWREPAIAGAAGVLAIAILFLALPRPMFSWVAARASHPWPVALVIAAGSAASASLGAMAMRRTTLAPPGPMSIGVASALSTIGFGVVIAHTPVGLGFEFGVASTIVLGLAVVLGGGFVAQLLVRERRPWVCGMGAGSVALLAAIAGAGQRGLLTGLPFGAMATCLGALGARLARRYAVQPPPREPTLPPAQLQ